MNPYRGSVWRRPDGLFECRVKAGNNKIVLTSHVQGYENELDAYTVLAHLLWGGPHVIRDDEGRFVGGAATGAWVHRRRWPFYAKPYEGLVWQNDRGKFDTRIVSRVAGQRIVFTSHNQGYDKPDKAFAVLEWVLHQGPHVLVGADGEPVSPEAVSRRSFRAAVSATPKD